MLLPLRGQRVKLEGGGQMVTSNNENYCLLFIMIILKPVFNVQCFVHCFDVLNIIIIGIKEHTANLG